MTCEQMMRASRGGGVDIRYAFRFQNAAGAVVAYMPPGAFNGADPFPETRLSMRLHDAETVADVRTALDKFVAVVEDRQNRTIRHMAGIAARTPELDISHYVYFSATVMTTIGSADITPARPGTRYLVTLQAFFAVFFLGYAVNLLWPHE
jgi:hypothetical protein